MGYTQDELDAAVEKLVKTTIRRQYGALGTRRTDLTFSDVQDAAAGVFVLYPNAPFYVVFLATARLREAVAAEQTTASDFIDTVSAVGRRVTAISNLGPLANAKAALEAMSTALGVRSSTFVDIEEIPAFQRFDKNTERFLAESGKNVRQGGEIVRTPADARSLLDSSYFNLKNAHTDILRRARAIENAITDYEAMNLPGSFSATVISNAQRVLADHLSELELMGEKERLSVIRTVVLDVLATRAVVRGFGSMPLPTMFVPIEGTGSVFADSDRPAAAAELPAAYYGPYALLPETNELDFALDAGANPTMVALAGSFVATAESTVMETYDIGAPNTVGITNNQLRLEVKNYPAGSSTLVDVTLTTGATQTAQQVCTDIDTAILGLPSPPPIISEPYPFPLKFSGNVNAAMVGLVYAFTSTNPLTDFTQLPIEVDDLLVFTDYTSANYRAIFKVTGIFATYLECSLVYHPTAYVDEADKGIQVGGPRLPIRLRVTGPQDVGTGQPDYRLQALNDKVSIFFPETGTAGKDIQFNTATTLGWVPVSDFVSRRTTAQEVVNIIRSSGGSSIYGVARVDAEAVFTATAYSGRGKADPYNFLRLIASKLDQRGLTATTVGVASYSFNITEAGEAGVVVGDIVAIRVSVTSSDVGATGVITSVTPTSVEATFPDILVTLTGLGVEIGPDLSALPMDATAVVSGGTANDGAYPITAVGTIPFELDIGARLPVPATTGNLSPTGMTLEVGFYKVHFKSLDTTTGTSITLSSLSNPRSAVPTFFPAGAHTAKGATPYLQLPELPKSLEVGDVFELYNTQFDEPDFTSAVVNFDSDGVVELADAVFTSLPDFVFSQESAIPFARIRRHKTNNYAAYRENLASWLELPAQQDRYFRELSRLLTILKASSNPTLTQLNDVKLHLQAMESSLSILDGYLAGYSVDAVDQVDTIVASFLQEGADRAVDILLEARFSDFFGLDIDEVSYTGNVQKNMKDVQRLDLPIRRAGRMNRSNAASSIIASYEEPDFEYDKSDVDDVEEPDIPTGTTIDL